jgi:hypothetical protein
MLTQLNRLSVAVDGRYASDRELKFIEDYLESVEQRIETYQKIGDNQEQIVHQTKMLAGLSLEFEQAGDREIKEISQSSVQNFEQLWQEMSAFDREICTRDMPNVLRCMAAAMLIDDLDLLRDGMLLWYETIVRSFGFKHFSAVTYKVIQDAVRAHLSPEEAALIMPALQLNHSLLSS